MEVSGQDILSKDKVPLRLNLTAGFRIQDPLRAKNGLSDISGFLYKELQFALRGAVGERNLDGLIEVGRSSQATLLGREEITVESLYLSPSLLRDRNLDLESYIIKAHKQITLLKRHGQFSTAASFTR
jgi:regulator of protease activity HflC (stomatin/prohibitin superfamily)